MNNALTESNELYPDIRLVPSNGSYYTIMMRSAEYKNFGLNSF